MSEAKVLDAPWLDDFRGAPAEHRIFIASPLGTLGTVALLFILLFGSFLALAAASHAPILLHEAKGAHLAPAVWPAFVLSLLFCAALGVQRYSRIRAARDLAAFADILSGGYPSAQQMVWMVPPASRLAWATVLGVLLGAVLSFVILTNGAAMAPWPPLVAWSVLVITLTAIFFTRGVELTRIGLIAFERCIREELRIDLLRIDKLSVVGRIGAIGSLVWLIVSAVICLFFVVDQPAWFTLILVGSCAAMGLWLFVATMLEVHRAIVVAKAAELESIRRRIENAQAAIGHEANATSTLQGLLAFEARIESVREWPFDQTTMMRVAAYVLIPTVPWFGQAIAQRVIETVTR